MVKLLENHTLLDSKERFALKSTPTPSMENSLLPLPLLPLALVEMESLELEKIVMEVPAAPTLVLSWDHPLLADPVLENAISLKLAPDLPVLALLIPSRIKPLLVDPTLESAMSECKSIAPEMLPPAELLLDLLPPLIGKLTTSSLSETSTALEEMSKDDWLSETTSTFLDSPLVC